MTDRKKQRPPETPDLDRRRFVTGVAAAGGLLLSGCSGSSSVTAGGGSPGASPTVMLPDPESTGIDHIVVVMMENRSFDHYLGWVPGADGRQAGTLLMDKNGKQYASYDLAPKFQNFQLADPDHSYAGGRTEVNGGKMDGFLLPQPPGDTFPIGYYTADSLPFFRGCADNWTICDRYFCAILDSTTPNRIYMHAGQTDRLSNTVTVSTLPTVWDRMMAAGHSVAYYYADVPYTAYWGSKYKRFSKKYDMTSFKTDIANGKLAELTYIDNVGTTANEGSGVSRDDHPYADIRDGQAFLNGVYNALITSPNWERTLLVINYDEWGGFYDHVPPPKAPITAAEAALGNDGQLGCRVPCVIIGPRARRKHVEHLQFDHNSVLNMIAWRFGFKPLGARASSANLAFALDFDNPPNPHAPLFDVPQGPFGQQCLTLEEAAELGVPVPPGLPVVCLPANLEIPTPPVPGLDIPSPQLLPTSTASLQRRAAHARELQAIRDLAQRHGFA